VCCSAEQVNGSGALASPVGTARFCFEASLVSPSMPIQLFVASLVLQMSGMVTLLAMDGHCTASPSAYELDPKDAMVASTVAAVVDLVVGVPLVVVGEVVDVAVEVLEDDALVGDVAACVLVVTEALPELEVPAVPGPAEDPEVPLVAMK
jgi:hypothetical protein